jgi:hypothetical protein
MQKEYEDHSKEIKKFKEEISFYCDNCNVNSEILFPVFMELWPESNNTKFSRKELSVITSNILNELIKEGILCINEKKSDSLYAFYKVLPHYSLIKNSSFVDKKRALNLYDL